MLGRTLLVTRKDHPLASRLLPSEVPLGPVRPVAHCRSFLPFLRSGGGGGAFPPRSSGIVNCRLHTTIFSIFFVEFPKQFFFPFCLI